MHIVDIVIDLAEEIVLVEVARVRRRARCTDRSCSSPCCRSRGRRGSRPAAGRRCCPCGRRPHRCRTRPGPCCHSRSWRARHRNGRCLSRSSGSSVRTASAPPSAPPPSVLAPLPPRSRSSVESESKSKAFWAPRLMRVSIRKGWRMPSIVVSTRAPSRPRMLSELFWRLKLMPASTRLARSAQALDLLRGRAPGASCASWSAR
jgi:hypothetical protein